MHRVILLYIQDAPVLCHKVDSAILEANKVENVLKGTVDDAFSVQLRLQVC